MIRTGTPDGVPRAALAVSAPARVRDRLRAAADGEVPVLHRGRHAVYLDVEGHCVGVVTGRAALVPCALRLAAESFTPRPPQVAYLRGGLLHLDGRPLVVGRTVDVRVPRLAPVASGSTDSATYVVTPPAAVAGFVSGLGLTARWAPDEMSRLLPSLVGRGDGLTPLGDDLVCGWLAVHRAVGGATPDVDRVVRDLLPGTTSLSAALLDCALHGETLPQVAAYLSALGSSDEPPATEALLAVGHTSGAGLLHGARLALAGLTAIGAAA